MSNKTFCDIKDCKEEGESYRVYLLNIEIVPTGNSDYSAYEEKKVVREDVYLCNKHAAEYDKRIEKVMIHDQKGYYFPNE